MSTLASTPKATTVWKPRAGFEGWPLTYLKPYSVAFEAGMSSMTPSGEWFATRGIFVKPSQLA